MTAISKDNPVYFGNDHDAHVNARLDFEQRQQWKRIKDEERTRYENQAQRVDTKLQDALAPPQPRAPFVAFAEVPEPQAGQGAPAVAVTLAPTRKNKTAKTLAFEAEVVRLMGYFWDNRAPGTEPTKGDLHPLVFNELLRGKVKSKSGKLNLEMIRDAAKQWTMPVVLPPYIPPAQTGEKRHPFKGDK